MADRPNMTPIGQDRETSTFKALLYLKCYYDENRIFLIQAILKHKHVDFMRIKMLFTVFKYLFSFQRYSSF